MSEQSRQTLSRTRRRRRRLLLAGAALLLLAAVVRGLLPEPLRVEVAAVRRGPLAVTVDEDGKSRVRDRYTVAAPVTANLERFDVEAGQTVERGELLAVLSAVPAPLLDERSRAVAASRLGSALDAERQARTALASAEVALAEAERELGRQRALEAEGAVAARERELAEVAAKTRRAEAASARFAVQIAAHEVEMARAALAPQGGGADRLLLDAPVAGRILKVSQIGTGLVTAGTPLLEIGDPAALEIVVEVLSTDAVGIPPGAPVRIHRWGGEGELAAHVRTVEPAAFTSMSSLGVEEQRVNVIVDLDDPPERWARLGDAYRVEASIIVWQEHDVLAMPASAAFRSGDSWATYVLDGDIAELVPIRLGQRSLTEVQIVEGLDAGQLVVRHPNDELHDGARVAVAPSRD